MLIYKYVDADILRLVLASERVAFTHPRDFNDPFDRPRVSRQPYGFEYHSLFDNRLMTREVQAAEADAAWNECFVSSFTRTFDNALMWAHYANKHTGAVIEIDADQAGLMSKHLLIPVQFGSVIYMKRPMPDPGPARGLQAMRARIIKGGEDRFNIDNYEGLQRLFLTKALAWAYEEEVRAVCEPYPFTWSADGESVDGTWKRIVKPNGQELYGYRLQAGSITRIFAGLRFGELDWLREEALKHEFKIMLPVEQRASGYEVAFESDPDTDTDR